MSLSIEIRESRGVRTLHFGSDWVQGAMRVSRPWDLELAYTREMMAALILSPTWPSMPLSILQIGLGAGSLTRFIHRYLPEARQTVVELSPAVVGAARQMFQLPPPSERLNVVIADGAQWVAQAAQTFDLILVDGFDADSKTGDLETLGFYQHCRSLLKPSGVMVANLLSRSSGFLEACLTLTTAFDGRIRLLPQTPGGNVIALTSVQDTVSLDESALRTRALLLAESCNLDLRGLVERMISEAPGLPFGITS